MSDAEAVTPHNGALFLSAPLKTSESVSRFEKVP